jgi:CheY-like chemotaxis protein
MTLRILVVDDEADVEMLFRQQFRRELRAGRFAMDFAKSGGEALTMMHGSDRDSLILLVSDINMPGMSGLELLPRIKSERPDLPVIMITAYGDAATRRVALERGADGLIPKPVDFSILKAEIETRMPA